MTHTCVCWFRHYCGLVIAKRGAITVIIRALFLNYEGFTIACQSDRGLRFAYFIKKRSIRDSRNWPISKLYLLRPGARFRYIGLRFKTTTFIERIIPISQLWSQMSSHIWQGIYNWRLWRITFCFARKSNRIIFVSFSLYYHATHWWQRAGDNLIRKDEVFSLGQNWI